MKPRGSAAASCCQVPRDESNVTVNGCGTSSTDIRSGMPNVTRSMPRRLARSSRHSIGRLQRTRTFCCLSLGETFYVAQVVRCILIIRLQYQCAFKVGARASGIPRFK